MAKKPAKKTTKSRPKKTVTKKPAAKKTLARKPAAKKTPTKPAKRKIVKGATRKPADHPRPETVTRIIVRKDVGFGNEMFIRGEGGDLDWNTGVHMECTGAGEWTFETTRATGDLIVKVLINDREWSDGENIVAPVGEATVVTPSF